MLYPPTTITRYKPTKGGYATSMDKDGNAIATKLMKAGDISLEPIVAADTPAECIAEQVKVKAVKDKAKADNLKGAK